MHSQQNHRDQQTTIRKRLVCAAAIFFLQLLHYLVFSFVSGYAVFILIFLSFLITAGLIAYQSDALTHQHSTLLRFSRSFFPSGIGLLAVACCHGICYALCLKGTESAVLSLVFGLLMLLLGTVIVFAVGAARTMLYADQK